MMTPLFRLTDKSFVFRGDKLHVHPDYWRQAGAVVTAEFEAETREAGQVVVRSDNGAVPSIPLAALSRNPHPDTADCMAISLALDCDVHEVTRRDLKLWRASRDEAPATPQGVALTVETLAQELRRIGSAGAEVLADALMPFLSRAALTQPTTVQQAYRVFMDGDQWCAVGPAFVDLQQSPAGFAGTPYLALERLTEVEGEEKRRAARKGMQHGERKEGV